TVAVHGRLDPTHPLDRMLGIFEFRGVANHDLLVFFLGHLETVDQKRVDEYAMLWTLFGVGSVVSHHELPSGDEHHLGSALCLDLLDRRVRPLRTRILAACSDAEDLQGEEDRVELGVHLFLQISVAKYAAA